MKILSMKRLFFIAILFLIAACSSDDSDSSNNNSNGNLTRMEVHLPTIETNYNLDFEYDSFGRIKTIYSQTNSSFGESNNSENFTYNSEGQIWKISKSNFNIEYAFSNGLIESSFSSPSMYTGLYFYNDLEQLERQEIYDENGDLDYEINYLYDGEGNIMERQFIGSSSYVHTYEYDDNNNPFFRIFQNQEIGKIYYEVTPNNILSKTRSQNTSSTVYTYEYDYNSSSFPMSNTEHQDGSLVGRTNYFY